MQKVDRLVFSPEVPPDLEHASQIREEAFDWLDAHYPGVQSFTTGAVLGMAGERGRRWLIARLRARGIGNEEELSLPATADTLTVLFLRSKGVKFREAVDAVVGGAEPSQSREPRYGGVWNRLIEIALKRLRRRLTGRLLGAAVFSLLREEKDHPNCLIIVKHHGLDGGETPPSEPADARHDYVYRTVLERPAPSCWVLSPFREVLFLDPDQLPTRAEVTSRNFVGLRVQTEREVYELLLGTMNPASVSPDGSTLEFVGRILDIVFLDFEQFLRAQSSARLETATVPGLSDSDDIQLWLITQLLQTIYPGSLCEISESSPPSSAARVLASSVAKPWEPSLWDPPEPLRMLSGYSGRIGVPLVVESVEEPWTSLIESVEPEMRYLASRSSDGDDSPGYSAIALPIALTSGDSIGAFYMLLPRIEARRLDVEVRVLTVFSRIIGEIIERQRAAMHTANVSSDIATSGVLKPEQFGAALLDLLNQKADVLGETGQLRQDVRLPFLLLSAHSDPDDLDPAVSERLKEWLVETLRHLEWRSFIRSRLLDATGDIGAESFIGEVPGVGMMIALNRLVSKDELDRIRNAFPTTINRISPTNSPVKLVVYVLDVPGQRILDAAQKQGMQRLADDVMSWAFEVATVVDDVSQSYILAHEQGEWDAALRRVRKALRKEGGRTNAYLRRLAAECSFSLGEWPSALKYAQEAATLDRREMGSGLVRSLCLEGDARLCLGDPVRAWDLYTEAASRGPSHPLPRSYRGQALLLMARLLHVFEDEQRRANGPDGVDTERIDAVLDTLVNGAMEDLTSAADLLDRWGLIPESYQYRNFHLVPTLMGQGAGHLLNRSPGPAASRFQSARRSFPKDDLFFREFLFAKCWEQGLHRHYGALLLSDEWAPLRDRLDEAFGKPPG
jgi:hypothetical protein